MVRPPYGRCLTAALIAIAASLVGISADAQQILLLDFWSPQCGPCMQMKPLMQSFERAGYPIRQIDTSREWQFSQQHKVSQIPCLVMLVNGKEFERQIGLTSSENLQQMFERAKDEVRRQNGVRTQSPEQVPLPSPGDSVGPGPAPREQRWPPGSSVPNERPKNENPPTTAGGNAVSAARASLLAATVRLGVEDAQGRSFGTGTIIDTRSGEALIITCAHLFRESQGKGPVKVDLYEPAGDGVRLVGQVTGQVISYDLTRDVALVSIRPDRPLRIATLAAPRTAIERGDRVVSIGCSNGKDPTVLESRITSLDRYQGPPNIEASGAPAIGRSGGGLFNTRGELIGICNNADPEGNEGIYAGLESIHAELDRLGLKDMIAKSDSGQSAPQTATETKSAVGPSVVRGQEPPITPVPGDPAAAPAAAAVNSAPTKLAASQNLSETEQAALEEIMSRAVDSEVVCIIRPKNAGGQSEVIQLDKVSPEFIQALRQRKSPAAVTR